MALGLRSVDHMPTAVHWAQVFAQLHETEREWHKTDLHAVKHLMRVLLEQPSPRRAIQDQKRLRSLTALAILLKTLHLHADSSSFVHGMAQLLGSDRPDWLALAQVDVFCTHALGAWEPPPGTSATALEFRDQLKKFAQIALPAPAFVKRTATASVA